MTTTPETATPLPELFRNIADEDLGGELDRTTWKAAWFAAARILEEAKPIVPPGPCWHDSGFTWSDGRPSARCDLLAGHAGAHKAERPNGGIAVWPPDEDTAAAAGITITAEERQEAERVIRESVDLAVRRAGSGRSSMPLYINDVAMLAGLAAQALELIPMTEADDA